MDCEILRLHCVSLRMTRMWEFENNSSVNCVDTFPSKGRQELATDGRPYDGNCIQPMADDIQCDALMIYICIANDDIPLKRIVKGQGCVHRIPAPIIFTIIRVSRPSTLTLSIPPKTQS